MTLLSALLYKFSFSFLLQSEGEANKVITCLLVALVVVFAMYLITAVLGRGAIVVSKPIESTGMEAHLYYCLPKGYVKVSSVVKVEVLKNDENGQVHSAKCIEQSFSTESLVVPDRTRRFGLYYNPNIFANDDITFGTNQSGLLDSIHSTVEDRLPKIITDIAAAPTLILAAPGTTRMALDALAPEIIEFKNEFIIDPDEKENLQEWLITESTWNTSPVDASFSIKIDAPKDTTPIQENTSATYGDYDGLFVRQLISIRCKIKARNADLRNKDNLFVINMPDNNSTLRVPMRRESLVKKQNDITLVNGMISSVKVNKPSQVEAFVQMPVNVLKAIVSIPAQLISLRIDMTTKANTLFEKEQTLRIGEMTRALKTQEELIKAQTSLVSNQNALELAAMRVKEIEELKKKIAYLEEQVKKDTNP